MNEETTDPTEEQLEYTVTHAPPLESPFARYCREHRLLNSLLVSLAVILMLAAGLWNIVVWVAPAGDGDADFSDGGTAAVQQNQEKKKIVKLMQRQKKAQPKARQTFRTTAISDISLPDFNELDVKDLAPVVEASPPSMSDAGMNNLAMKSALKGIGLTLPKTMQQRCDPKKRIERLRSGGGKDMTEAAIIKGLNWLQSTQDPDGGWESKDKGDDGKPVQKSMHRKKAISSLALLAYLGHCELQDSPTYGETVRKAIDYITSMQPDDPAAIQGGNAGSYAHPIHTYALCEAYTMTKIPKLKEYARRAAAVVVKGQNESGGWAYGYGKGPVAHTDLSVTGWNIQALKAAALTGIPIEGLDEAMDKAIGYVKRCQDKTGKFAYKEGSGGKSSLTGTGVLSLQIWKNASSKEAQQGLDWIIANQKKEWKHVDVYAWYYMAQAAFQATGVSGGSKYWRAWNKDFQSIVCGAQASDGHWPHGAHGHQDSDVYRTALTILMLEVYYRYMPSTKV